MTRTHGRCAKGQRLLAKVPHGRRETLTFIAALRCDGLRAPCLLDGPIDAHSFLAWIEQVLVPTLRPGDIVVMDNLSSHRDPAIRCAIRNAGAKLFYLPKYSPDLNPIEQAFVSVRRGARVEWLVLDQAAAWSGSMQMFQGRSSATRFTGWSA